jgi:hypothetical protein
LFHLLNNAAVNVKVGNTAGIAFDVYRFVAAASVTTTPVPVTLYEITLFPNLPLSQD